jgi:hypothetical protein
VMLFFFTGPVSFLHLIECVTGKLTLSRE